MFKPRSDFQAAKISPVCLSAELWREGVNEERGFFQRGERGRYILNALCPLCVAGVRPTALLD